MRPALRGLGISLRVAMLAFALSIAGSSPAGALTTIDTGAPTSESGQCCVGATWPGGPGGSFGQVVTAPAGDTVLDRFSFYVRANNGLTSDFTIAFRAEVHPWDGLKAAEPNLWESETQVHTLGNAWTEVTFEPAAPPLVPGKRYVIFVTTEKDLRHPANDDGAETELTMIGAPPQDNPYTDGFKVEGPATFSGDTSPWTTENWTSYELFGQPDRAFKATFSAALTAEGAPGSANCSDGRDNDLDALIDALDPDCRPPATGPAPGSGSPAPTGASDKEPPAGRLSGATSQSLGRTLAVTVTCPAEACVAEGSGSVRAPTVAARTYALTRVRKTIRKGGTAQLRLRLSKTGRDGAERALRRGRKVRAAVTVTLTDAAGNRRTLRRTITLKLSRRR